MINAACDVTDTLNEVKELGAQHDLFTFSGIQDHAFLECE